MRSALAVLLLALAAPVLAQSTEALPPRARSAPPSSSATTSSPPSSSSASAGCGRRSSRASRPRSWPSSAAS